MNDFRTCDKIIYFTSKNEVNASYLTEHKPGAKT